MDPVAVPGQSWVTFLTENWKKKFRFLCTQPISTINPTFKFTGVEERKLSSTQSLKFSQKLSLVTQPPYFNGIDVVGSFTNKPFVFTATTGLEKTKFKTKFVYTDLFAVFGHTTFKHSTFGYSFGGGVVSKYKFRNGLKLKFSLDNKLKGTADLEKKLNSNWSLKFQTTAKMQNFTQEQVSFGFGINFVFGGSGSNSSQNSSDSRREITDSRGDSIIQIQ